MGISTHIFRAFLREHKHRPFVGKGLLIGRQSVFFDVAQARHICESEGVPMSDTFAEADVDTRGGGEIIDYDLFASFCDMRMDALDITAYEHANIVHDMNEPVPEHLENQYDFIFNGSCMDNLFSPGEFMNNCTKMLRPGGRVVNIEHGSMYPGAYITYSPDYFLDYYAVNDFADALVIVCEFQGIRSPHHIQSPWMLWNWNPLTHGAASEHSMHKGLSNRLILSIAEKGENTSSDVQPVQGQYRTAEALTKPVYDASCERFLNSDRLKQYRSAMQADWAKSPAISNLEFLGVI